MKIHEYQAKEILRKYGVPVPDGEMATTLEQADTAAKALFGKGNVAVVVKAQIHAGGRGKGGGSGNVEGTGEVGAGATRVHQEASLGVVERDTRGSGAHRVDETGNLFSRLAACVYMEEHGGNVGVRAFPGDEVLHEGARFVAGEGGPAF